MCLYDMWQSAQRGQKALWDPLDLEVEVALSAGKAASALTTEPSPLPAHIIALLLHSQLKSKHYLSVFTFVLLTELRFLLTDFTLRDYRRRNLQTFTSTRYFFAAYCLRKQTFTIVTLPRQTLWFHCHAIITPQHLPHPAASSEDQAPLISFRKRASDVNCMHSNSFHLKILHMTICTNSKRQPRLNSEV